MAHRLEKWILIYKTGCLAVICVGAIWVKNDDCIFQFFLELLFLVKNSCRNTFCNDYNNHILEVVHFKSLWYFNVFEQRKDLDIIKSHACYMVCKEKWIHKTTPYLKVVIKLSY